MKPQGGFFREMQAAAWVLKNDPDAWDWLIKGLPRAVQLRISEEWEWQAHPGQLPPDWVPGRM